MATEFTRAFKGYLEEQSQAPFTKVDYDAELAAIARKHTVKDIMKLSSYRYKAGEAE
jgi:hypothetical protein